MSVRRKIPVPSFAPPAPIETNEDASEEMILLAVNEQCMIHLENALQLFLHKQKQQTNNATISFADFARISGKVDVNTSSSPEEGGEEEENAEIPKDPKELSEFWFLSKAERFWHDLYCVAVPSLYQTNNSVEKSGNSPRPKKRRRLAAIALELKAAGLEGKRVGELRKLVKEAGTKGVPKSKSERAIRLLEALKQEKENNVKPKKAKNKITSDNKSVVDSLLQNASAAASNQASPKSTIEERIRARAKERERNLEEAKAARKDPREERVAIADALYSYASHTLRRRQSRNKGNQTNKKKCVVTFDEVVKKGLPKRSRKEIGRILLDIVTVLRDSGSELRFLKWKDLKTGEACGLPISKDTTVTIDTSDFKIVRETLNKMKA